MLKPMELGGVQGVEGPSLGALSIYPRSGDAPLTSMTRSTAMQPSFTGAPSAYDTGDLVGAAAKGAVAKAGTSAALNALQNSLAGAENLVYAGGELVPVDVAMGDVLPFSSYAGSVLRLAQGDVKGAAGSALGTYIGSFFGPVGTFVGSLLGGGCYITEAVVAAAGGDDKHPVLETLRWFRDNKMLDSVEGTRLVNKYYETAPKIVSALEKHKDRDKIYSKLYNSYLAPAADAALRGKDTEALRLYSAMVNDVSKLTGVHGMKTVSAKLAKEPTK